jgi:hypothetical protein
MQVGHNVTDGIGPPVKKSQNASCKERGEELPESSMEPSVLPFRADTAIRHTLVSGHRRVESGKQKTFRFKATCQCGFTCVPIQLLSLDGLGYSVFGFKAVWAFGLRSMCSLTLNVCRLLADRQLAHV